MLNTVQLGDCLDVLRDTPAASVDAIYLDPPFFTQKKHSLRTRDGEKLYSFDDSWEDIGSYVQFMKDRLQQCRRVLKDSGSIFLHCDKNASHHLRLALDEIFGEENFQSEIIWAYRRWSNSKKGLLNAHQVIYFYSKTKDYKFVPMFEGYSPTTNIDQIFQKRSRNSNGKTGYRLLPSGETELVEQKKGVPLSDVWNIPYLNPKAKERVGYPTQKPILLLERIISLVSSPGDVVLDPFCGSGTTLVAAQLLNRQYVGIDTSAEAVTLSRSRLANPVRTESALLRKGQDAYLNQSPDIRQQLLSNEIEPVERNANIDGFLKVNGSIRPIPVKILRTGEPRISAEEALRKACKRQNFRFGILLGADNQTPERNIQLTRQPTEIQIFTIPPHRLTEVRQLLSAVE